MVGATEAHTHRVPLTIEQIPLPVGYDRRMLDPDFKRVQRLRHEAKVHENLVMRYRIGQRAEEDIAYRTYVLGLCKKDPEFFIDHFGWTYDDRVGEDEPMVLYDFQRTKLVQPYLRMVEAGRRERRTLCCEKSRGIGYTWVELFMRVHSFLFRKNWSILIGSVYDEEVDDGGQEATHESLFGKIRYIISMLPAWMRDELLGPTFKKDSHNKRFALKNPLQPKNVIHGKHFGKMFGRSRRYREVWGDEIAHAEQMKNADTSLKQTTNLFSGGSTPLGKATFHYQLMYGPLKVTRHTLHWSEHPELDIEWYNEQREHMTDEQVAQELDISYEGSVGGRVLPEVKSTSHLFHQDPETAAPNAMVDGRMVWDGTLYTPTLKLHACVDPGISDPMACIWVQEDLLNDEWRIVDFVQVQDRPIDWLVPFLLGQIPEYTYDGMPWPHEYNGTELAIIERHGGWDAPEEVFGDDYGTTRSMATGASAYDVLANYGIYVCGVKILDEKQSIGHLQTWFRHVRISGHLEHQRNGSPEFIPTFWECMTQWRYKQTEEGMDVRNLKPLHDRYCHAGDACKMYAQMVDVPQPRVQPAASGRPHRSMPSSVSVSRPYRPRR